MPSEFKLAWIFLTTVAGTLAVQVPGAAAQPETSVAPARPALPAPPLPRSPVAHFRELLGLPPAELERVLAEKSEAQRTSLRAKIREYAALDRAQREARLEATELRWFLRPLMETAAVARSPLLAAVPEPLRALIESRLQQWDTLTPEVRAEVLENERFIHIFLRVDSTPLAERNTLFAEVAPARRAELEQGLARWQALSEEKRQLMCDRFEQFFELPPAEKVRTLNTLSEAERRQMESTLASFEKLPPAQRRLCVNSFSRFAGMTPPERAQFLKSAERWKEMSPAERQTWRKLVAQLPPVPPGLGQPRLPPAPPRREAASGAAQAPRLSPRTNGAAQPPPP